MVDAISNGPLNLYAVKTVHYSVVHMRHGNYKTFTSGRTTNNNMDNMGWRLWDRNSLSCLLLKITRFSDRNDESFSSRWRHSNKFPHQNKVQIILCGFTFLPPWLNGGQIYIYLKSSIIVWVWSNRCVHIRCRIWRPKTKRKGKPKGFHKGILKTGVLP